MGENPAVSVNNVTKTFKIFEDKPQTIKERIVSLRGTNYKKFTALDDVSFEVYRGQTFGLVGSNGSGKSTMLKIINRTMFPNEGSVEVEGKVSSLIELGAGFHQELSGRENIYTNATIFGLTRDEITERLPDIIAFSELEDYIDNPIRTYSSGMYARLGFSVAIHVNASILLVDEILGVGDYNFQRKCSRKIHELRSAGVTIIMVTHDLGMINELCDQAVWLDHGKMMDRGEARVIQQEYLNFMNSGAKTFVPAALREEEKKQEKEEKAEIDPKNIPYADEQITSLGEHGGSGEVVYTDFRILDSQGQVNQSYTRGKPFFVEASYRCNLPAEELSVNFGFNIFNANGQLLFGHNTKRAGEKPLHFKNKGIVRTEIDTSGLLPGLYGVGLGISNEEENINYDNYPCAFSFTIQANENEVGLIHMDHKFYLEDATFE